MDVISIWQPYATLLVRGHKRIETRGFPAPRKLIGTRLGIASTKVVRPEQRAVFQDPKFREYYDQLDMPALDDLPHGYLIGSVLLKSCDIITEDDFEDVTEEEQTFGWWQPGRYAWRTVDNVELAEPIPVRGQQGVWSYTGPEQLRLVR